MADAAKVQGVTVANLAKMWGTTVANIAKVMGLTVSSISGTVTAGTSKRVHASVSDQLSIAQMDATHAICVFRQSSATKAVCLSLSGTTITVGTAVTIEPANPQDVSICAMSSTHAIVAYCSYYTQYDGYVKCLTLSGTTITVVNATTKFKTNAYCEAIAIRSLSSTRAVVTWRDHGNSYYGSSVCISLSGTTLSVGSTFVFNSADTGGPSSCTIDSTHLLVVYTNAGNSNYGTAVCLTLSDTTLTAGTPTVYSSSNNSTKSVCLLDSTHALVAYQDVGASSHGKAVCLTLSGTSITANAIVTFNSASSYSISITQMDATHAIVAYQDGGNSNYGTAQCLTLSGTTVTTGTETVYLSGTINYQNRIVSMGNTLAIVYYQNSTDSYYGTACCLTLS